MSNKTKSTSISKGRIFFVLFVAYMVALVYLYFGKATFSSSFPTQLWGIKMDWIAHFLMFFPFPFLSHASFPVKKKWRNLLFVFLCGIVIAYVFELFQSKIAPTRTTDPWDLVINIASLSTATFIMSIIDLFRK